MRRQDRAMNEEAAQELIRSQKHGRLGLISQGKPYIVPVHHVTADDDVIYIHSAKDGKKISAVRKNPEACFEVDELIQIKPKQPACDSSTFYRSALAFGKVHLVKDKDEKIRALNLFIENFADADISNGHFSSESISKTAVIKMDIETVTGKENLPTNTVGGE